MMSLAQYGPHRLIIANHEKSLYVFKMLFLLLFSLHPYLFFNDDRQTFTFVGFVIDNDGRLKDHRTQQFHCEPIMNRHLRLALEDQNVCLDQNFEELFDTRYGNE